MSEDVPQQEEEKSVLEAPVGAVLDVAEKATDAIVGAVDGVVESVKDVLPEPVNDAVAKVVEVAQDAQRMVEGAVTGALEAFGPPEVGPVDAFGSPLPDASGGPSASAMAAWHRSKRHRHHGGRRRY
jgi:hypothetical protein